MAYNKETGMYEGFIYKIWNDVNDCIYIGRTYRTLEKRWKEHCEYSKDHKTILYDNIRSIGLKHFELSVIENLYSETLNGIKEMCFSRERYWIEQYKLSGIELYNMTNGGDDVLEKKFPERPVIQYDLFCNEINRFNSITEAGDKTGISHSDISTCCSKNGKIYCTNNYIWRYAEEPLTDKEILELNNRYKGVCQYDFNGNLLNTFYRPIDACRYLASHGINVDSGNITACSNGKVKSVAGFIWRYRMDSFDKYPLPKRIKKVNRYLIDGTYVDSFESCADAERKTGVDSSSINQCCLKHSTMAGGYIWAYDGDNINIDIKIKEKSVDRYSLDFEYIDTFNSIEEASIKLGINRNCISATCNNKNKSGGGYIWRFSEEDISTYQFEDPTKNKKPVRIKPLKYNRRVEKRDIRDGSLIEIFENEYLAAQSVSDNNLSAIHNCLTNENHYTYKGYYFCYEGEYNPNFKNINRYRNFDVYDLQGNYIKTLYGFDECKEFVGLETSNVSAGIISCCNGNQKKAYGYIWKYEGDLLEKDKISVINLYDIYSENIVQRFNSFRDIVKSGLCNRGTVYSRINNHIVIDGKYALFRSDEDFSLDKLTFVNSRHVEKYDLNGNYICSYKNTIDAALDNNTDSSSISKCCNGKIESLQGYNYIYVYEEDKYKEVKYAES